MEQFHYKYNLWIKELKGKVRKLQRNVPKTYFQYIIW